MKFGGNRFKVAYEPGALLEALHGIAKANGLAGGAAWYLAVAGGRVGGRIVRVGDFSADSLKGVALSLARGKLPRLLRSGAGAASVLVGNNVIAFYPDRSRVVKVFGDRRAFSRYVEGVRFFQKTGPSGLKAPDILAAGDAPAPHIVEAMIPGRPSVGPVSLQAAEVDDLVRFHFQSPETSERVLSEAHRRRLKDAFDRPPFDEEDRRRVEAFLGRPAHRLLRGPTHGDLCASNVMRAPEGLFILDWEKFDKGPVASDLKKLWVESDDSTRSLLIENYNRARDASFPDGGRAPRPDDLQDSLLLVLSLKLARLGSPVFHARLLEQYGSAGKAESYLHDRRTFYEAGLKALLGGRR